MNDHRDGSGRREAPLDLASVFLGPKAENADVFEVAAAEAVRDQPMITDILPR
jgi:hypothetical protein